MGVGILPVLFSCKIALYSKYLISIILLWFILENPMETALIKNSEMWIIIDTKILNGKEKFTQNIDTEKLILERHKKLLY